MRTVYMHTLNGRPAYFDGSAIVYLFKSHRLKHETICATLSQVKDEQLASHQFCDEKFGDTRSVRKYDYARINIKEQ